MQHYTLRQLEYLVTCVDCGSIAKAAEILNVSQPTISVAIAKLEKQFGVQLLLRHKAQGVSATPSARSILTSARNLLGQANDLERQALSSGETLAGTLRLGSFSTLAPSLLPQLIRNLGQAFPSIDMSLTEGTQEYLLEQLFAGALDLALIYDIDLPKGLSITHLDERFPYVALPADHPLATQQNIALSDLTDLPLILLDVPPSRAYFLGLFADAGLRPNLRHSSPSLELVRGMVGQGLGYSILVTRPHSDTTYDGNKLAIRPLAGTPRPSRTVLASLSNLTPTRLVQSFEKIALETLQSNKT